MQERFGNAIGWIVGLTLWAVPAAAWLTHVIHCIQEERWVFLLAGAIFAPIGVVHGIGLWIGFW